MWPTEMGSDGIADLDEIFSIVVFGEWYANIEQRPNYMTEVEWHGSEEKAKERAESAKRTRERVTGLGLGKGWNELAAHMVESGGWSGVPGTEFPSQRQLGVRGRSSSSLGEAGTPWRDQGFRLRAL